MIERCRSVFSVGSITSVLSVVGPRCVRLLTMCILVGIQMISQ